MRYLGLDLGTRSLGLSISDETKTISSTLKTIKFAENDYDYLLSELSKVLTEFKISKMILGLPKNMNNTLGYRCEETLEFTKLLENRFKGVEVVLQDERLTTVEATNYMLQADISRKKRKKKIDALAANIILQTYLDKENGGKL